MIRKITCDVLHLGNEILERIFFLFFLLTVAAGGYAIWDNQQIYQHADASLYSEYRPTEKTKAGFEELQAINPEVRGWIRIDGTQISYPIVQGEDNYKYVNKDAVGKDSLSGSIFLDYRNASDFSDPNNILYGHHMAKDTMFGELDKYSDLSFFESHRTGALYDGSAWHEVNFLAFLKVNAYDPIVYDMTLQNIGGKESFAGWLSTHATYWKEDVQMEDGRFLTLSTCTSDGTTNGRYVLIGWMQAEENNGSGDRVRKRDEHV